MRTRIWDLGQDIVGDRKGAWNVRMWSHAFAFFLSHDRFRWLCCQLEVLFPTECPSHPRSLPESLDETYERILREIKKSNKPLPRQMLQLEYLIAAVRPLRVKELAEVLVLDFSAEGIPKLNPDWHWEDQGAVT